MKKNYISPKTNVFNVIEERVIASSFTMPTSDGSVDEVGVLGRENNSVFDRNIWDQGW